MCRMLHQGPPPLSEVFGVWEQLEFRDRNLHLERRVYPRLTQRRTIPQFFLLTATPEEQDSLTAVIADCYYSLEPVPSVSL